MYFFDPTTGFLAVEEPLEIKTAYGKGTQRTYKSLAVTMCTPSDDLDLAMGFFVYRRDYRFIEGGVANALSDGAIGQSITGKCGDSGFTPRCNF